MITNLFCCWQFLTSCWGPSLLWGWEEWWCPAYSVSRVAPAYGPSSAPWPAARNVASNAAVAGRVAKNAKVCFHHWKPFSSLKTLFRSKFLIKLSESMVMSDPRSLMVPGSWSFLVICKRRLSIIIVIDVTNAYQVSGDNPNVLEKQLKFLVKFMIFHNCQWIVALWLL